MHSLYCTSHWRTWWGTAFRVGATFSYRYCHQELFFQSRVLTTTVAKSSAPYLIVHFLSRRTTKGIMDHSIKKRKRRDAEEAAPVKTNGADRISKKTKKTKKPAPEEEEDDEDDFEGFDEEQEAEEVEIDSDEVEEEQADANEDEETNAADLPTENAPILPMAADAQSFDELKLSEKTMTAIKEMGFTKMTSIQKSVRLDRSEEYCTEMLTITRPSLLSWLARTCSVPPRLVPAKRWRF